MTDFPAENRTAPNGPAPFPTRDDESQFGSGEQARPAPTGHGGLAGPESPAGPGPAAAGGPAGAPGPAGPASAPGPTGQAATANGPQRLASVVKGRIDIADEVVEKVAALAAYEVEGVADLGGDIARALETVRERIGVGQKRGDQGVKAQISGREVAIKVTIMVEYGHVVLDVARRVQANVALQTNRMLGLNVVEVNVNVDDVRMPRSWSEDQQQSDGMIALDG